MWEMMIPAAMSMIGSANQADAQRDAAAEQAAAGRYAADQSLRAARESNQLTADVYKQGLRTQAPALQGGQLALSALMSGMGLGAAHAAPGAGASYAGPSAFSMTNNQGVPVDANGVPVGGQYGINGIDYGATQSQLNAAASPYAGTFNETFTPSDIYTDPSYKWRLEQGQADLNARRAATGNRFGSQAMKDITNYGQGAASQEYAAANERFLKNKSLLFDRLSGLAGMGTAAGNAGMAAGQTAASQIGSNTMAGQGAANEYLTGAANAGAAGRIGSTNAIVGGLNQGLNNYYQLSYLNGSGGNRQMYGTPYSDQGMWDRANQYQEG